MIWNTRSIKTSNKPSFLASGTFQRTVASLFLYLRLSSFALRLCK